MQDNVGNGIDTKPIRIKQEHGGDKMLVGDEADVAGSSNTAKEKSRTQTKEHSKATEPESKGNSSNSRSDDKKAEKSTKSLTINGPSKSDHSSKRVSDTTESQGNV